MNIFSCCKKVQTESVNNSNAHLSYCQKVGRSAKLAVFQTIAGAVAGATLTAPYGIYQGYLPYSDVQKADKLFKGMQSKIDAGIDTFNDRFQSKLYLDIKAHASKLIYPAIAEPVIVGTVLGGCFGACLGVIRIFQTVLFPSTVKL